MLIVAKTLDDNRAELLPGLVPCCSNNEGALTLVVPPLGTQMTKEKMKNHQALTSFIVSMN